MHFDNIHMSLAKKKKHLAQAKAVSKSGRNHEQFRIFKRRSVRTHGQRELLVAAEIKGGLVEVEGP